MFKSKTTTNFKCQNYYRKLNKFYFMSFLFFFFFFWPHYRAAGIRVSQTGIEPKFPALEAWTLNHWTTRKSSVFFFFKYTVDS